MSSLSVTQMHHKFIIFCANSFWIDFFPQNLLWIHYLYREFTMDASSLSPILYLLCKLTMNFLFYLRINFKFTIFSTNLLFREFTLYLLSFSRNPHKFTIFREFAMNPLSFWRTHFDFLMSIFDLFWPQIRHY